MPIDPKQFDDDRLDEILRDVAVPADLHDRLRQIPQLADTPADSDGGTKQLKSLQPLVTRSSVTWTLVLAASLLAVAAFAAWQWLVNVNNDSLEIATGGQPNINIENEELNPMVVAENAEVVRIAELDQEISTITTLLAQVEIQKIEQRLSRVESNRQSELTDREVQSMIIALSDQVSLPLGGDPNSVKLDMAQVMEKFPGSRGAEIARQFLNQLNN